MNKQNRKQVEGVRCFEAETLLGNYEWQLGCNGEYDRIDLEYDRIIIMKKLGHLYAELVQGDKHIILYDVDDTGRNEGELDAKRDKKEGREIFTFL